MSERRRLYVKGSVAMLVGTAIILAGDSLLGAEVDVFRGISTFTAPWIVSVFLVPFVSGWVVAKMYGEKGGKWLACIPPMIARFGTVGYLYFTDPSWGADLFFHLHIHYWGPMVILVVEAANIGGVLGEFKLSAYIRNDELRAAEFQRQRERDRAELDAMTAGLKTVSSDSGERS